jgi:hypothetical protein
MRYLVGFAAAVAVIMMSTTSNAQPPSESGVVVRVERNNLWAVFPDSDNGYWVFSDVTRDDFCAWFEDMGPFPMNETPDALQAVFANDALVLRGVAGGPTWLHPFVGNNPGPDPCTGSEPEAELWGDIRVRTNDNDVPNQGERANAFGDVAQGVLADADGMTYHYSWVYRALWNPDGTQFTLKAERYNLHPIR